MNPLVSCLSTLTAAGASALTSEETHGSEGVWSRGRVVCQVCRKTSHPRGKLSRHLPTCSTSAHHPSSHASRRWPLSSTAARTIRPKNKPFRNEIKRYETTFKNELKPSGLSPFRNGFLFGANRGMPLGLQEGSGGASYSDACLGDEGVREVCASLASLPSLPLLTSLDLRGNHIHADGAAAVAKLLLTSGCALQLVRAGGEVCGSGVGGE